MSSASSPHEVVKRRWLGFLIWQSIVSTAVFLIPSVILLLPDRTLATGVLSFIIFDLSLLLLSVSLFLLSSPHPDPSASLSDLASVFLKACLRLVIGGGGDYSLDLRRRVGRSFSKCFFLFICAVSGFLSTTAVCEGAVSGGRMKLTGRGINGVIFGFVYGVHYLYHMRWILKFPIIQAIQKLWPVDATILTIIKRPFFYSFKMGLSPSFRQALKLSTVAFFPSFLVIIFLSDDFKSRRSIGMFILYLFNLYVGVSVISFAWELSIHLLQVVLTRRCCFAPSRGSAAAETNPSEVLLIALEQSSPGSLLKYLAYLDLCMVSENNVEPWRRAAFFEETGDTYRRVISLCLRPLEHLTSKLVEGLDGLAVDKSDFFSQQLNPSTGINVDSDLHAALNDLQLYSLCSRTVAALTARSHSEDRYGVAQLTSCNVAVVSTLLSALLSVEACMGKKTSSLPSDSTGPASIRWITPNTARHDIGAHALAIKKRGGLIHSKAYAMADILRTSIYEIVYAFHADMHAALKASALDKSWVVAGKPLYGTREILVQKQGLSLEQRR
ncbi:hypothetical protein KSP40_PGU012017 [Platanthera guangdongensis]|uniref:Nucleoporin NDC1 n=1 Tax=Platanthera guangdongensis TaxID=2320717 RepID=A0ABR2MPG7_9ASPA